jgi:hypothetical protein
MKKLTANMKIANSIFTAFESNIMDPDPDQNVQIETWIRNMPSVRISWEDDDEINRNITAYMEEEEPDIVQFEINAWNDTYDPDGFDRRWTHEDMDVINLKKSDDVEDAISEALVESYQKVTGISGPDLREEKRIQGNIRF